jgi:hypothetical protein
MEEDKSYINKDLYNQSFNEFSSQVQNPLEKPDFTDKLEWSMMMIQSKFKAVRARLNDPAITANTFDKAFLLTDGFRSELGFMNLHGDMDFPKMFPDLNMRMMLFDELVTLTKVRCLSKQDRNKLYPHKKYACEHTLAYYQFGNEAWYANKEGYQYNDALFNPNEQSISSMPHPLCLRKGERYDTDAIKHLDADWIRSVRTHITFAHSMAFTMYYEWCLYVKDADSIGLIIPIDPRVLKDIFDGSAAKIESRKQMICFIRDHYRRKPNTDNDYSVYVHRYLRGEKVFDYKGFTVEVIPPKYDLQRAKTSKTIIDAFK